MGRLTCQTRTVWSLLALANSDPHRETLTILTHSLKKKQTSIYANPNIILSISCQFHPTEQKSLDKAHLWPLYVRTQKPVLTSHILIVLSLLLLTWFKSFCCILAHNVLTFEILPHSRLWAERQHWRHCGRAHAKFSSTHSCWSPTAWPTCPRCSSPTSYPLCPNRHPENEEFAIEFPSNMYYHQVNKT